MAPGSSEVGWQGDSWMLRDLEARWSPLRVILGALMRRPGAVSTGPGWVPWEERPAGERSPGNALGMLQEGGDGRGWA